MSSSKIVGRFLLNCLSVITVTSASWWGLSLLRESSLETGPLNLASAGLFLGGALLADKAFKAAYSRVLELFELKGLGT